MLRRIAPQLGKTTFLSFYLLRDDTALAGSVPSSTVLLTLYRVFIGSHALGFLRRRGWMVAGIQLA